MKRIVAVSLSVVVVALVTVGCPKHKRVVDAGLIVDAGEVAAVVDAGSATVRDAGVKPVVTSDGGVAGASAATGPVIIVTGTVERSASTWKLGVQLAPAPPGMDAVAPSTSPSQLTAVITRATGPEISVPLKTSFQMQGITALGPIDEGSSGALVATPIAVPADATKIEFVVDGGRTLATLSRKPQILKVNDLAMKGGKDARIDVSFAFDPKAPVSWALYAEKAKGEWSQVATGDDQKSSATVPIDSTPAGDQVTLRLDATDGFNVVSQTLTAPRPKASDAPPAPADGGSIASDGG